jgi:hypothetical protein
MRQTVNYTSTDHKTNEVVLKLLKMESVLDKISKYKACLVRFVSRMQGSSKELHAALLEELGRPYK